MAILHQWCISEPTLCFDSLLFLTAQHFTFSYKLVSSKYINKVADDCRLCQKMDPNTKVLCWL